MHDVKEGDYQVEGNREVCAFLDKWRKKAGEGKINFVGLVACASPTESFTDHVGVIGTEFAANFGCDNLKMQVMSSVFRRMPPSINPNAPANKVVFNLASAPCSFDFLAWILTCELVRIKEGAPAPLQVTFSFGADQDMERCFVSDQRKIMFDGVMKPLIPMIGAVEVKDRGDLREWRWPDVYTLRVAQQLVKDGIPMPPLRPSNEAVEEVGRYLNGRRPVTITLREATHWPHRNSVIPEWIKFCDWASGQGEDIIVVRDTTHADQLFGAYHTMPRASKDINVRHALYERAKCNLFVGNGPATMAFHTKVPWLMFAPIDPSGAYPPGRPEWWHPHHGISPGEQFAWSAHDQRIIWEVDTFENIRKAWCDLWDLPHKDYPMKELSVSIPVAPEHVEGYKELFAPKKKRGRPKKSNIEARAAEIRAIKAQLRKITNGKGRYASR